MGYYLYLCYGLIFFYGLSLIEDRRPKTEVGRPKTENNRQGRKEKKTQRTRRKMKNIGLAMRT